MRGRDTTRTTAWSPPEHVADTSTPAGAGRSNYPDELRARRRSCGRLMMIFSAHRAALGGQVRLVEGDLVEPKRPGQSVRTSNTTVAIAAMIAATSAKHVRSGRCSPVASVTTVIWTRAPDVVHLARRRLRAFRVRRPRAAEPISAQLVPRVGKRSVYAACSRGVPGCFRIARSEPDVKDFWNTLGTRPAEIG